MENARRQGDHTVKKQIARTPKHANPKSSGKPAADSVPIGWRRTARSRLGFELAGLAFACQHDFTPKDYARHLWSRGAAAWMGKERPGAAEYLRKEAEACRDFYPEVSISLIKASPGMAELVFTRGCLGGWGNNPWALAWSLGLTKRLICAYCQEAFHVWTKQLGLASRIGPTMDGRCHLLVVKDSDLPVSSGAGRSKTRG